MSTLTSLILHASNGPHVHGEAFIGLSMLVMALMLIGKLYWDRRRT